MNTESDIIFESSELPLCATLISKGFLVVSVNKRDPGRIVFCFQKTPSLVDTINNYWDNKVLVEPKSFWSIQRELKSRIRNESNF